MGNNSVSRSVSLKEDQDEFLRKNDISPTPIIQDEVSDMMDDDDPYRHVDVDVINSFRREGFYLALAGLFVWIVTMFFAPANAILTGDIGIFAVAVFCSLIAGTVIFVVGALQVWKWSNYARQSGMIE